MQLHIWSEGTNNNSSLCSVACTRCLRCKYATMGRIKCTGQSVSEKGHKASLVSSFPSLCRTNPQHGQGEWLGLKYKPPHTFWQPCGEKLRMNTEAWHSCEGKRETAAGWIPCSGAILPPLLHADPSSNKSQNTAVWKKNVSTEETLKWSNSLTAHQPSVHVFDWI